MTTMLPPAAQAMWVSGFLAALTVALVSDLWWRRLPNLLTYGLALAGVAHAVWARGAAGAPASLLGAVLGMVLLYVPFRRGWIGGGDVKLLAAIGAWVGPLGAASVLLLGAIAAGVLSLVALVTVGTVERRRIRDHLALALRGGSLDVPPPSRLSRARGIPFGVALVIGAIAYVFVFRSAWRGGGSP